MEAEVLPDVDLTAAEVQVVGESVEELCDVRAVLRDGGLHELVALLQRAEGSTERV